MGAVFCILYKHHSDIRIRLLISPKHHFENPGKHHEESLLVTFKIDTSYPRSSNVSSSACGVMWHCMCCC